MVSNATCQTGNHCNPVVTQPLVPRLFCKVLGWSSYG